MTIVIRTFPDVWRRFVVLFFLRALYVKVTSLPHAFFNFNATQTISQPASSISITINHLKLARLDSESVRQFLNTYNQHVSKFIASVKQLKAKVFSLEFLRPVHMEICVDVEFLQSTITLSLIPFLCSFGELKNSPLCEGFDNEIA